MNSLRKEGMLMIDE